jgi:hypothetical protein
MTGIVGISRMPGSAGLTSSTSFLAGSVDRPGSTGNAKNTPGWSETAAHTRREERFSTQPRVFASVVFGSSRISPLSTMRQVQTHRNRPRRRRQAGVAVAPRGTVGSIDAAGALSSAVPSRAESPA